MAQVYDKYGNNVSNLDIIGGDTLIDSRAVSSNLSAVHSEIVVDCALVDSASFDLRGTFVATLVMEATINGIDWFSIPFYSPLTEIWATVASSAGIFIAHLPSPVKRVRVRVSAYTSGTAIVSLRASSAGNIVYAKQIPTTTTGTLLTAANTTGTLTLAAAGVGLFHYITRIEIVRVNSTGTAVTGSAILSITTTNLGGSPAWTIGNALAAGDNRTDVLVQAFGNPIKSSSANTATTIVLPAGGTGVQYRINVSYYVGA